MKTIRPYLVYFLPVTILLALGVIFRSFVLENIIVPLALFFWAILRALMSIDRQIYWALLIFATFLAAVRLVPYRPRTYSKYGYIDKPWLGDRVGYWKSIFSPARRPPTWPAVPRDELLNLLVSVYAVQKQASPADVRKALETRQLPLPAHVDAFFFSGIGAPGKVEKQTWMPIWLRKLAAHPKKDNRRIEEVLQFIESISITEFDHAE